MELVSIRNATRVGNPGFAGTSVQGSNAFAGAADSYLTFPTTGLLNEEFSAVFWYKINNALIGLVSLPLDLRILPDPIT